jgi:hypothetical protein
MKFWLDTEFIDDGKTIELISIGIVSEDGREYYAQSCEFDLDKISEWVQENVLPSLHFCPYQTTIDSDFDFKGALKSTLDAHCRGQCTKVSHHYSDCLWRTRRQIADELQTFCDPQVHGTPEFWGWCSAYDFVALCQLFGTMMDLPAGFPHYMRDLQYLLDERGVEDDKLPPQSENIHNALVDAQYIQQVCELLAVNVCHYCSGFAEYRCSTCQKLLCWDCQRDFPPAPERWCLDCLEEYNKAVW